MSARKILIVDPEISLVRELGTTLAALGYEAAAIAGSGEEAIGMAPQAEPDLVLTDTMLGAGMNGLQAAEELRRLHPVPIVFLTAEAGEASLRKAGNKVAVAAASARRQPTLGADTPGRAAPGAP
jgi:CheY-like chemotaxis protein